MSWTLSNRCSSQRGVKGNRAGEGIEAGKSITKGPAVGAHQSTVCLRGCVVCGSGDIGGQGQVQTSQVTVEGLAATLGR